LPPPTDRQRILLWGVFTAGVLVWLVWHTLGQWQYLQQPATPLEANTGGPSEVTDSLRVQQAQLLALVYAGCHLPYSSLQPISHSEQPFAPALLEAWGGLPALEAQLKGPQAFMPQPIGKLRLHVGCHLAELANHQLFSIRVTDSLAVEYAVLVALPHRAGVQLRALALGGPGWQGQVDVTGRIVMQGPGGSRTYALHPESGFVAVP
jgi:hypothetical protein